MLANFANFLALVLCKLFPVEHEQLTRAVFGLFFRPFFELLIFSRNSAHLSRKILCRKRFTKLANFVNMNLRVLRNSNNQLKNSNLQ